MLKGMNRHLRAMDVYAAVLAGITVVLGVIGLLAGNGLLLAVAGITLSVALITYPLRWAAGAIAERD